MGMRMRRSRSRRSGGATTVEGTVITETGSEDHTSPVWLLITAGVFGLAYFIFSTIQITSTIQAAFVFLQSTITVTPSMTAADLLKLQSGQLQSTELIANVIGWSVQLTLLIATFPSEHYVAWHIGRARHYAMIVLIGADALTDFLYVLAGHTIFDGFLHLAPGGLGVVVVAVIYPIAVMSVTVFCGVEMAHRLDKLIQRIKLATFR